eukprot:10210630-Heterocapsa_arctica.AAC.1
MGEREQEEVALRGKCTGCSCLGKGPAMENLGGEGKAMEGDLVPTWCWGPSSQAHRAHEEDHL